MINSLGTQRIIGKYAVKCQPCEIKCNSRFWTCIRDVRGGAFSSEGGRGEDKNPGGGAGRRGKSAGRGGAKEPVNRLIQKFEKSAYIIMEIFVVYYDVLINENIISSHF